MNFSENNRFKPVDDTKIGNFKPVVKRLTTEKNVYVELRKRALGSTEEIWMAYKYGGSGSNGKNMRINTHFAVDVTESMLPEGCTRTGRNQYHTKLQRITRLFHAPGHEVSAACICDYL